MNEQELKAIKFSEEVDALLARNGHRWHEGETNVDNELLSLAGRLHAVDVTASSKLQSQLWCDLSQQLELKHMKQPLRWSFPQLLPAVPKQALWAIGFLIVLFALLFTTPVGRSAKAAVQNIIRELRWENTTVQQVKPGSPPENLDEMKARIERERAAGRAWSYSFEGINFGGCCADGMRNEAVSLEQAIAEADRTIMLPGFVPDGYALVEVRLLGHPPYSLFAVYEGTDGRLGFYQSSGGVIGSKQLNETTVELDARASAIITDGVIEEIAVGDVIAALMEGYKMVWEENGVTFQLIGPGLDVEMLVKIAESLEPAR